MNPYATEMGLAGANAFFQADDARVLREQERQNFANQQERFAWERQRAQSELGDLPDLSAARRGAAQLTTARSKADLGLVNADAAARGREIEARSAAAGSTIDDLVGKKAAQPFLNQTYLNQAQAGTMTSDADLKLLPQKIQRAAVQGQLDHQGQVDVVLGTLGQLIARQDKAGALDFANSIAKIPNVLPGMNGVSFTDIRPVEKGQMVDGEVAPGNGYAFTTPDGKSHVMPVDTLRGAMEKMKSGKYHFIHTNDGSVYSGNEFTGAVTQVHRGDPRIARAGNPNTPREIQLYHFYTDELKYPPQMAEQKIKELGHKPRQEIEAMLLKEVLPLAQGNTPQEKAKDAYARVRALTDIMFQQENLGAAPAPGAPAATGLSTPGVGAAIPTSNSAPTARISPLVSSLLGIPSQ